MSPSDPSANTCTGADHSIAAILSLKVSEYAEADTAQQGSDPTGIDLTQPLAANKRFQPMRQRRARLKLGPEE
jgi:hypothetical protein